MSAGDVADVTGDFRMGTWMCRDGKKGPRGPIDDDNVKSIRHSHRQSVEDSKSVAISHEGTREVTTSKYRQIGSVVSCFVANMFYGGLATSYGVMYTYLKESLGVSEEEVTWIGALFGGFSGIAYSSDGPSVSLRQTVVNCLQVFKIPGTITASIAHIAFGFSFYTFSTFVPEYVTTSISRLTATQAALVVTAPGYGSMAGRIIFSAISMATDKAANYIFLLSICGMGVTNLLIPLCENPTAFYINGTVYGLALGGFFGVLTLVLVQLFGLHNLSKTFGMLMMCLGFGAFGGSPIQSYLSTIYDRDIPFYLAGGSFILTMMLMLSVVMRKQMVVCGNRRQSFNLEVVGFHNAAFITGNQDATV